MNPAGLYFSTTFLIYRYFITFLTEEIFLYQAASSLYGNEISNCLLLILVLPSGSFMKMPNLVSKWQPCKIFELYYHAYSSIISFPPNKIPSISFCSAFDMTSDLIPIPVTPLGISPRCLLSLLKHGTYNSTAYSRIDSATDQSEIQMWKRSDWAFSCDM